MLKSENGQRGGLFSVALSCGSPRVGVTHHCSLRSPDVPRALRITRKRTRLPSQLVRLCILTLNRTLRKISCELEIFYVD